MKYEWIAFSRETNWLMMALGLVYLVLEISRKGHIVGLLGQINNEYLYLVLN
jgi:hypothetical protein